MRDTAAIILAGGRGSRMNALCAWRPKPLLPFASGLKVIDFTLSNSVNSGIKTMAVLVDYQRQLMIDYLRRWAVANTSGIKFHIAYPATGTYNGTADAIYQNLDYLKSHDPGNVLILAGDHVYNMDYRGMLAFHDQSDADVTIGVIQAPSRDCSRFGIVALDSRNRVTDFEEKPSAPKSNLASMGIYIFKTQMLADDLLEDSARANSVHDFGRSIIPGLVKSKRVFAYRFDGYWRDIGTAESYHEANMDIVRQVSTLCPDKSWPVFSAGGREFPLKAWNNGKTIRSIVSRDCVIKGKVINSLLAPGVVVDSNAVVRNSIVMSNTFIGRNSTVDNSILDEEITTGESCHIGLGNRGSNRNITVLGKRRIIQSYCNIPYFPAAQEAETIGATLALAY